MFEFCTNRISMFFILIFLFIFVKRKYSVLKTVLVELGVFVLTTVIEYFIGFDAVKEIIAVMRLISITLVMGVTFYISQYRDFRALFIGICGNCYALIGNVLAYLVYSFSKNQWGGWGVLVLIDVLVLALGIVGARKKIMSDLEYNDRKWSLFCLVPAMFYLIILLLVTNTSVGYFDFQHVLAIILLLLLMMVVFMVVVYVYTAESKKIKELESAFRVGAKVGVIKNTENIDSRGIKIYSRIMMLMLVVIIGTACVVVLNNRHVNNSFHYISYEDASVEGAPIQVTVKPRGGEADSWNKRLGNGKMLCGVTYELIVSNHTGYRLNNWEFKLVAPCDMYINSAWCGNVEVHQFRESGEIIQEINLREVDINSLYLEYESNDKEVLIELNEGDYFIYKPNANVSETPIEGTMNGETVHSVACGLIFYKVSGPYRFTEGRFAYTYTRPLTNQVSFIVLVGMIVAWIAGMLFLLGYRLRKKSEYELQQKDRQLVDEIMEVLVGFVDAKDTYTAGHSNRVAEYSRLIAREMGWSEAEVLSIYYSGLLHDCGKVSIPENILNKPGRLTDEEFEIIKSHTVRGYEVLKNLSTLPNAATAARSHHERYDGKGYPDGKKGEEIPLLARIISVADAFDAMNYSRVYRPHLSKDKIKSELNKNSGTQFDPEVVQVLLRLIRKGQIYIYDGPEGKEKQ